MVTRIGGARKRTRSKLSKKVGDKGKISITNYMAIFKEGDKVALVAEPAIQKAMFFPRFYGKAGIIKGKRGRCYEITINDGGKEKTVVTHPVHIKRL